MRIFIKIASNLQLIQVKFEIRVEIIHVHEQRIISIEIDHSLGD